MESTELLPHTTLNDNQYEILERIGKGGMGCVYRAMDNVQKRIIALKQSLFSTDSTDYQSKQELFEQEANLLKMLDHPGLPKVHLSFQERDSQFLVMDFIEGPDLGKVLDMGFVCPPYQAFELAVQLLQIVDYLHSRNPQIFHRDIKPQNVKLSKSGQLFLLDFGIAKDMSKGTILRGHSPYYSPPEQFQNRSTDARGDLYSIGATLYHLASGQKPADANRERNPKVEAGNPDPIVSLRDINQHIPENFADLIHRALSLNPNNRPESAKQMLAMANFCWSKAALENLFVSNSPVVGTAEPISEPVASKVQRAQKTVKGESYKFWEGKVTALYSPERLTSPTTIAPESLKIKLSGLTTFTVVVTDVHYDRLSNIGDVYHTETYQGSVYSRPDVALNVEMFPHTFRLYVLKQGEIEWEWVDINRKLLKTSVVS